MKQVLAILGIGFFLASIASHIEDWRLDKQDAAYRIQHAQRLVLDTSTCAKFAHVEGKEAK